MHITNWCSIVFLAAHLESSLIFFSFSFQEDEEDLESEEDESSDHKTNTSHQHNKAWRKTSKYYLYQVVGTFLVVIPDFILQLPKT